MVIMELRTLAYGLAAFLISAVLMTLLGLGDAAGNTTGLLFWALLAILAIAYAVSRFRNGEHEPVRVARWLKHRDGR
jgi:flagellar biogenesis protein FliO